MTDAKPARRALTATGTPRGPGRRSAQGALGESRILPYALILPGFAFYAAFVIVPIVATLSLSLFRWDGLATPVFVGIDNFRKVLGDPNVRGTFGVAIAFVLLQGLLPVLMGLVLTVAMTRARIRGLSLFRLIYFIPYTLALAVVAIAWRWLLALNGSANQVVGAVLGEDAKTAWLGDFFWAMPALGVIGAWVNFGFVLVLLLAGAQRIPRDLYDQARVDGAGIWREFLAVTLPGLRYELSVGSTMTVIFALRMFDLPLMTTRGGPGYATTTPSLSMYRSVFQDGEAGIGSAIAALLTIVVLIAVLIVGRVFRERP
jgi:raffinose/stachyose/melibiose transport system permease protein